MPSSHCLNAKFKPPLGGLRHLRRLLRLGHDIDASTDVVFISLDLEVASNRKILHMSSEKPVVTQIGLAKLDTRDMDSLSCNSDFRHLISVRFYQVSGLSLSKASQTKAKKKCVFAKPRKITQDRVPETITQNLRIRDKRCKDGSLRNIVLVGQSINTDLRILQYLDMQICDMAPILTSLDTYFLARHLLPPYDLNLPLQPGQGFSLAGILSQLGCEPDRAELHNAGNDAVYSMYAMLLLAVKDATRRSAELNAEERRSIQGLKAAVVATLFRGVSNTKFVPPTYDLVATEVGESSDSKEHPSQEETE